MILFTVAGFWRVANLETFMMFSRVGCDAHFFILLTGAHLVTATNMSRACFLNLFAAILVLKFDVGFPSVITMTVDVASFLPLTNSPPAKLSATDVNVYFLIHFNASIFFFNLFISVDQ